MNKESQLENVRQATGAVAELQEKKVKSPRAPRGGLEVPPEAFGTPSPEDKSRFEYERDIRYQTKIQHRRTPEYVQRTRRTPEKKNYGSRTFDPTSTNRKDSNVGWRKIRKQLNQDMNIVDISLEKKSILNNIPLDILKEVFHRGIQSWTKDSKFTPEQFAFNRVNSFISGGFARKLDEDLSKACWKGYEAIGMKKKKGKMVPNCVPVKEEGGARDVGTDELVNKYKSMTPGQQSRAKMILKIAKEKNNV